MTTKETAQALRTYAAERFAPLLADPDLDPVQQARVKRALDRLIRLNIEAHEGGSPEKRDGVMRLIQTNLTTLEQSGLLVIAKKGTQLTDAAKDVAAHAVTLGSGLVSAAASTAMTQLLAKVAGGS